MTDRFYPMGMHSAENVWKSSYEVQNEMKIFERSMYPPGTSIHVPGARENFGYSTPGGLNSRKKTANQQCMEDSYYTTYQMPSDASPKSTAEQGAAVFSPTSSTGGPRLALGKSRSQPMMTKMKTVARLSEPLSSVEKHEDALFSYFVPLSLQKETRDVLRTMPLSKLQKHNRISFPFSGDGTGFRSACTATDWWPSGSYSPDQPTAYRETFNKPQGFHRQSPLSTAGSSFML